MALQNKTVALITGKSFWLQFFKTKQRSLLPVCLLHEYVSGKKWSSNNLPLHKKPTVQIPSWE
jgi:hypothetical protein